MSQLEEPGTSPAPSWLDLPEKVEYWTCSGSEKAPPRRSFWSWLRRRAVESPVEAWTIIFYTQEDAEAAATVPNDLWEWDREPAFKIRVSDALRSARVEGVSGVAVQSYQNGAWVTVKAYPAGVPLRGRDDGQE